MDPHGRGRGRGRGNRGNYDNPSNQGNFGNYGRRGSSGYRGNSGDRLRSGSRGGHGSRGGNRQFSRGPPSSGFGQQSSQEALDQSMGQLSLHSETELLANHFKVSIGRYTELYRYGLTFQKRQQGRGDDTSDETKPSTKPRQTTKNKGIKKHGDSEKVSKPPPNPLGKDVDPKTANLPGDDDNGNEPTSSRVAIEGRINRSKIKRIIALLISELKADAKLAKIPLATNYSTHIVTADPILENVSKTFTIEYYDEYRSTPADNPEVFDVQVIFEKSISLGGLSGHLQNGSQTQNFIEFSEKEDAISALNIIFSYHPYERCFPTFEHRNDPSISERYLTTIGGRVFYGVAVRGRNGSSETGRVTAQGPLNSIPGFIRSVRTVFSADVPINLNINTKTSLFYANDNVQILIDAWRAKNVGRQWQQHNYGDLSKFLKGLSVRTQHLTGQQEPDNFLATITGLAPVSREGVEPTVSVVHANNPDHQHMENLGHYFNRVYNKRYLPNSKVFAVVVGGGASAKLFPADLLYIIPGQAMQKTRELPAHAIRLPIDNKGRILTTGRSLFYGDGFTTTGAREFDLVLGDVMISVPVLPLATPTVRYRGEVVPQRRGPPVFHDISEQNAKYGSWNLKGTSFFRPAAQQFVWTYIELTLNDHSSCQQADLDQFGNNLQSALSRAGMVQAHFQRLPLPKAHQRRLPNGSLPTHHHAAGLAAQFNFIDEVIKTLRDKNAVNLIVFLLPKKDMELYSAIKRVGDQCTGVATVCHVLKEDRKTRSLGPNASPDFYGNLSMKINLKMSNQSVNHSLAVKPAVLGAGAMVLGIDVTHAGALAMSGAPSIAAVVGSVDAEFAQWPASLRENPLVQDEDGKRQSNEQVMDLKAMVVERLRAYCQVNRALPQRILIYRDGLSEGQFRMCEERELPQITAAIEAVSKERGIQGRSIPIVLICAVKRHHTRLFPTSDSPTDTPRLIGLGGKPNGKVFNFNPMPGTMVTEKITYGKGQDFFLVSQKAQIGTARPTHYVILKNTTDNTRDQVAQATHDLCYLFGRSTGSVGVCPAAYYADLAADRARFYVRRFYHATRDERWDPALHPDHRFDLTIHESMRERMFYI
ncbi:hypothetical protein H2204_001132 [Knufia peltigerae]|uniref:Piwi domain-containing protein n=1 Tax=Knufia peltigerae TaxID=1002370 RepID=A0AA38YDY5_9EURO|nr:hypothetical protein H2204_001132 [Knufia peltigerae]